MHDETANRLLYTVRPRRPPHDALRLPRRPLPSPRSNPHSQQSHRANRSVQSLILPFPPISAISIPHSRPSKTGLPLMGFASTPAARYFGVFLVTAGTNANIPTALAYQANNVRGQWKRALCSAMFVAFGGIGGISGGTIFRAQDAPRYLPGIGAAIAWVFVFFPLFFLFFFFFLHALVSFHPPQKTPRIGI